MDGRGRCLDNVFIERLWRSMKYEAVYLHELADGFVARRVIDEWIEFYNEVGPHSVIHRDRHPPAPGPPPLPPPYLQRARSSACHASCFLI